MITCPKCGTDNMVGAIFCRGCSEKLNLDDLKPDAFEGPRETPAQRVVKMTQKIGGLLVAVILVAIIGSLFMPEKILATGELEAKDEARANGMFSMVCKGARARRYTWDNNQATNVANKLFGLPESGTGKRIPERVGVQFMAGGMVKLVLKTRLAGKIPMYTTVLFRPEVVASGDIAFTVYKVKTGKMTMVGGLKQKTLEQFQVLIDKSPQLRDAEKNIKMLEVGDNSCRITTR